MLRETNSSVRRYFGILAILFFFVAAGAAAKIALALIENPDVQLSRLFIVQMSFDWLVAFAFGFAAVRFPTLIREQPKTLKAILHARFWGSLGLAAVHLFSGAGMNPIGLVISVLIYVYLLRSIGRLAAEENTEKEPNQTLEPTAPSGRGSS